MTLCGTLSPPPPPSSLLLPQWGHDFRPDYKGLGLFKTRFPEVILREEGGEEV